MTYYFISDLHVDFYAPVTHSVAVLRKHFEVFFERNFLTADACCIAGDIANDYFTYVEFLKFIAEKYSTVCVCLGNHDIITEHLGRFGADKENTSRTWMTEAFGRLATPTPSSSANTSTGSAKSTYCFAIPSATLTKIPMRNMD